MNITPEEIARLRALEAKAKLGELAFDEPSNWCGIAARVHPVGSGDVVAQVSLGGWGKRRGLAICEALVESCNALPALLDEIERLRDDDDEIRRVNGSYVVCIEALRADLREALALLQLARPDLHGHLWRERCDALLAKHKEDA